MATRKEQYESLMQLAEEVDRATNLLKKEEDLVEVARGLSDCMNLFPVMKQAIDNDGFSDHFYQESVDMVGAKLRKLKALTMGVRY